MPAVLTEHSYGKSRIRLTKVTRLADRHEVRELTIEIELEGDFADSYTIGDNRLIIPTDTMKNVAYALAKEHPLESIEDFGAAVASHFLANHSHVDQATVRLAEQPLERIRLDGREHPHAFCGKTRETRTSTVMQSRRGLRVESGLDDLFLLKIDRLGLLRFLRDRYTTLQDAADRILATMLEADWLYTGDSRRLESMPAHRSARPCWRRSPGTRASPCSRRSTPWATAALEACPEIERITLTMPNKHRILVDLKPFGLENANEVFLATDEPHGTITGTLERA